MRKMELTLHQLIVVVVVVVVEAVVVEVDIVVVAWVAHPIKTKWYLH